MKYLRSPFRPPRTEAIDAQRAAKTRMASRDKAARRAETPWPVRMHPPLG
jgi:hypothetical protein